VVAQLMPGVVAAQNLMKFELDTYIVLDMPQSVCDQVKSIRERYGSRLAILPVKITVIGSSGIGTFSEEQEPITAFELVDRVASMFAPIKTAFRRVTKFPNSGIFYYEPDDPQPFIELQRKLVSTGLKFKESPFPFTPHCTIVKFDQPSKELVNEIMSLPVPKGQFMLDMLSIYSLNGYDSRLLHRAKLIGR